MKPQPPITSPPPTPPLPPMTAKSEIETPARRSPHFTLPGLVDLMQSIREAKRRESEKSSEEEVFGPPRSPSMRSCPSLIDNDTDSDMSLDSTMSPMTPSRGDCHTVDVPTSSTGEKCDAFHIPSIPAHYQPVPDYGQEFDDKLRAHQVSIFQYTIKHDTEHAEEVNAKYNDTEDTLRDHHFDVVKVLNQLSVHHANHALVEESFRVMSERWHGEKSDLTQKVSKLEEVSDEQAEVIQKMKTEKEEAICASQQATADRDMMLKEISDLKHIKDTLSGENATLRVDLARLDNQNKDYDFDLVKADREIESLAKERERASQARDWAMKRYDRIVIEQDMTLQENERLMAKLKKFEDREVENQRKCDEVESAVIKRKRPAN